MPRAPAIPPLLLASLLFTTGCRDDVQETTDAGPPMTDADTATDATPDTSPPEGAAVTYTEGRAPCADRNPLRNLYFGDPHVHTTLSFDAYGFQVRNTPDQAYAFARGEATGLPPLDAETGAPTRTARLDRPLDFAVVTDHAEFFGETKLCRDPSSEAYATSHCANVRANELAGLALRITSRSPSRLDTICGEDGARCDRAERSVWTRVQEAAERAYDRGASCKFTSFIGYEYTNARRGNNHHRNVIFRNDDVLDAPITTFDEPLPRDMMVELADRCLEGGPGDENARCDVLTIPHNSNQSSGTMFQAVSPDDEDASRDFNGDAAEIAATRNRLDRLFEVYQHKGSMECMNGLSGVTGGPDELCGFEKLHRFGHKDCGGRTGVGGLAGLGCVSKYDFLRNVLTLGLAESERLGVNPYKFGIVAATDTHNATPGMVRERDWPGHIGVGDGPPTDRLSPTPSGSLISDRILTSPGGLTAVWAVENSRDAIFEALRRREAYGTSGPRIALRLFAGWDLPERMCAHSNFVAKGYRDGVPMGGDLPARPEQQDDSAGEPAPTVAVMAQADPGSENAPGTPLERIQIIKGTFQAGEDGKQQPTWTVYDVAGSQLDASDDSDEHLDTATCERAERAGNDNAADTGAGQLCAVWRDPDFDPDRRAFYYARVLEVPTCRWSTHLCNRMAEDERPANCANEDVPKTIRERAWSSPVWYTP